MNHRGEPGGGKVASCFSESGCQVVDLFFRSRFGHGDQQPVVRGCTECREAIQSGADVEAGGSRALSNLGRGASATDDELFEERLSEREFEAGGGQLLGGVMSFLATQLGHFAQAAWAEQ